MKILSLGLDNSVLNKTSATSARVVEYGNLVEKYAIIVPSAKGEIISLSEKVKVYGSGGGNKLTRFFKIYRAAKKILREEGYDVITVQDQYYLALIGLWLAKKFKLGLEIQVHGFEKFYGLRELIAKYVLPRAAVVRCVSQRLKRQLIGRFGVPEEKIMAVSIFTGARSNPPSARNENHGGRFIFLTVGRLVPVKNIGLQIEAMAEVVKKYPKMELRVVGGGAESDNLKFQIADLKLEKNISMLGQKDGLGDYYQSADAFLLTSNSEGWGRAAIEAASFSLPIIMTEVGCAGEVIKDSESGLLIPVGDKRKLVEAMLKIIEDKNLRKKLGANAKLAVSRLPSKEQILNLYRASWQKALAARTK